MGPRLLTVGDNVVDQYPQQGLLYPGGNAVNVAVHARRLGADSAYIGAVGSDSAGEVVLQALRAEGVDTSRTRVREGATAHAVVTIVDGNRTFSSGDLGVSVFALLEDDLATAATYDVVHTGECSNLEDQLPDLAAAARRLSFDFSERGWDYIEAHAPRAHIAIRSSPDADVAEATAVAERLRALGPATVAVTLGARGALVLREALTYRPAPAGTIVDTLGAGDAFIARLLVGIAQDEPIEQLVGAATDYATAACATFGAFGYATPLDPSPTRHEPSHRPHRLDVS
ncbi:MAG: fructoselysine 6-kinase [Actinomycetota bacterium]|jgi:fructoselysine 6-kinase|nr:fructoselysine 6-kinase [Actinomycetota bacterium]